jgi:hypothetical protein
MDDYAGDGSNGLDSSDLFSSFAGLASTAIQEFGPTANTAILNGQSIATPNLQTRTNYASAMPSSSWLLILVAVVVGIFAFKKV